VTGPATPGVVELRGLEVTALVGVLPEERARAQPIELDIDVHVDVAAAAASDDLADAVDYGAVCDAAVAAVGAGHVGLLERLAHLVAAAVLAVDPRITAADVVVRKLRPPVPHRLRTSGVRVRLDR
jgi:7,8-dihydroneopterin aldolase/epimerase/oxygenase